MLCLHFTLIPENNHPAELPLGHRRLLGDVFNGWLKRYLIDHWPQVYLAMKSEVSGASRYAVLVPPNLPKSIASPLWLQLVLIGETSLLANDLMAALLAADAIELGPPRILYRLSNLAWSVPGKSQQRLIDEESGLAEALPDELLVQAQQTLLPSFASCKEVLIHFLSPLRLGQESHERQPRFLQLIRSLARKLRDSEPQTASRLELDSAAWYQQEQALRTCSVVQDDLVQQHWLYHSENQRMHQRIGWVGPVQFTGSFGPLVMQLLWVGQWIGIGQNSTGGQGVYRLNLD